MIFLDPPYDTNLLAVALEGIAKHGLLADDGCIICEFRSSSEDRRWSDDWEMLFSRQYGETTVAVLASSTDGGSEEQ